MTEAAEKTKEDSGAAVSKAYYAERRRREKESWEAYWRLRSEEVKGRFFPSLSHAFKRIIDAPVTWITESWITPLHDKYKLPYYHRRLSRVPDIDQCKVTDTACVQEANFQYRLDLDVDKAILDILMTRQQECLIHYGKHMSGWAGQSIAPCIPLMEDYQEAELNFFIKYGELGVRGDVRHALAKQKHRMIWERRHPEIMAEREAAWKEHRKEAALGRYDETFWRPGGSMAWHNKEQNVYPYSYYNDENAFQQSNISKDWQFYRDIKDPNSKVAEDEKKRTRWPLRTF